MRRRVFRFKNAEAALRYISFLLSQEITITVECGSSYYDVNTPFGLAPSDFPNPKDLA